eukprot:1328380-Rhodomonas_salina.1
MVRPASDSDSANIAALLNIMLVSKRCCNARRVCADRRLMQNVTTAGVVEREGARKDRVQLQKSSRTHSSHHTIQDVRLVGSGPQRANGPRWLSSGRHRKHDRKSGRSRNKFEAAA